MTQKNFDLDFYIGHINLKPEELAERNLPEQVLNRMQRIVDVYTRWTRYPRESDRDIALYIQDRYGINQNSAYEDVRLLKCIFGAVNQVTKDFARYRFDQMIEQSYQKALETGDAKSMVAAATSYAKFHMLDKEDKMEHKAKAAQTFYPVIDPRRCGFTSSPHTLKDIGKLIKKNSSKQIQLVKLEIEDYDLDDYIAKSYVQDAKFEEVKE